MSRVKSDQFRLHSRGSEEFLRFFEGTEVHSLEKRNDGLSIGANIRSKQNLNEERRTNPTLSMSVKSSRICDSSFRLVDKNPIGLNDTLDSPCSDSFFSLRLSNCCSRIYSSQNSLKWTRSCCLRVLRSGSSASIAAFSSIREANTRFG